MKALATALLIAVSAATGAQAAVVDFGANNRAGNVTADRDGFVYSDKGVEQRTYADRRATERFGNADRSFGMTPNNDRPYADRAERGSHDRTIVDFSND